MTVIGSFARTTPTTVVIPANANARIIDVIAPTLGLVTLNISLDQVATVTLDVGAKTIVETGQKVVLSWQAAAGDRVTVRAQPAQASFSVNASVDLGIITYVNAIQNFGINKVSAPADGQTLVWNATLNEFEYGALPPFPIGPTPPSPPSLGELWLDTSVGDPGVLKAYNSLGEWTPLGVPGGVQDSTQLPFPNNQAGAMYWEPDNEQWEFYDGSNFKLLGNIDVVTSATHPPVPTPGFPIYETDTGAFLIFVNDTLGFQPPWNLPWGLVVPVNQLTAPVTPINNAVNLTGMEPTFTAVAGRNYKISASALDVRLISGTATDGFQFTLQDLTANVQLGRFPSVPNSNPGTGQFVQWIGSFAAGARQIALRVGQEGADSGRYTLDAAADAPAQLTIEDIGPAGATP